MYDRIKVGDSITWVKQFRKEIEDKRYFLSQVLKIRECSNILCDGDLGYLKCERRRLTIDGLSIDGCEYAFETVTERQEFLFHITGEIIEDGL